MPPNGVLGSLSCVLWHKRAGVRNSSNMSSDLEWTSLVLVMNKCTVHSATGVNSLARERQAWQIRFDQHQHVKLISRLKTLLQVRDRWSVSRERYQTAVPWDGVQLGGGQ